MSRSFPTRVGTWLAVVLGGGAPLARRDVEKGGGSMVEWTTRPARPVSSIYTHDGPYPRRLCSRRAFDGVR